MLFEWDERKNELNVKKHGLSFEDAKGVFADPDILTSTDDRIDYGERREISIGRISLEVDAETLVVLAVHTQRGSVTRIISARKANRQEQQRYEEAKIFT